MCFSQPLQAAGRVFLLNVHITLLLHQTIARSVFVNERNIKHWSFEKSALP